VFPSKIEIIGQILEIVSNFDDNYRGKINAVSMLKMIYKGFLPMLVEYVSFLLENEMLTNRKYDGRFRITEKGFRFLSLYGELRQMISSKQKDRIREQDTFNSYLWPYQVATFTNPLWGR
jgi:predicted transcriptional regulator